MEFKEGSIQKKGPTMDVWRSIRKERGCITLSKSTSPLKDRGMHFSGEYSHNPGMTWVGTKEVKAGGGVLHCGIPFWVFLSNPETVAKARF